MQKLMYLIAIVILLAGCRNEGGGANTAFLTETTFSTSPSGFVSPSDSASPSGSVVVTPEPSTVAIFSLGLIGLAANMLKKRNRKKKNCR